MIAKMKKYAFLVFHQDYQQFLENLGKLGVLHVIERSTGEKEESLLEKEELLERTENVEELLRRYKKEEHKAELIFEEESLEEILEKVENLDKEHQNILTGLEELKKELDRLSPWGQFDQGDLAKLQEAGFTPRFYRINSRQFKPEWEEKDNLYLISTVEGFNYFVVLERAGQPESIDAEKIVPGTKSLSELQAKYKETEERLKQTENDLATVAEVFPDIIAREKVKLEAEVSMMETYYKTRKATGDTLRILEGWVPAKAEKSIQELVEKEALVSIVARPDKDEVPPVKLENKKFSRLFEPISKLFDLPSYGEMDLTPYFAPFFMLFFGFCLGDAGYGVFFILFASLMKLRAKKELKPILSLTQYLGVATIIFGLLSGTFFGINLIDTGYTLTGGSIEKIAEAEMPQAVVNDLKTLEGEYF